MFMTFSTFLGVSSALVGVLAHPSQLAGRASSSSEFSIFAYGSGPDTKIGGYPIFYDKGYAFIANPAKVNYTEDYVHFSKDSNDSTTWVADPLTVSEATWMESLFYIPRGAGPIGFYKEGISNVSSDDIITTGFKTYGNTVMVSLDGTLYTKWYAVDTDIEGLWSVGWNASEAVNGELISLSKGKPVNVNYPKHRQ